MDKLSKFCNNLEELIYHAKTELIFPKLDSINNDKESSQFFFIILWKLTNGLETSNLLFLNIQNKPQYADSMFISLRALIADMITINYVIFKADFKEEKLPVEIERLKFDHVKFTYENLKLYKDLYKTSNDELIEKKTSLREKCPNYFNEDGELRRDIPKLKSIKGMIQEMNCNISSKSIFLDEMIHAFEIYDMYSKYEHLGELTPSLVQRSFINKDDQLLIETKSCLMLLLKFQTQLFTEFYEIKEIESTKYWNSYEKIKALV